MEDVVIINEFGRSFDAYVLVFAPKEIETGEEQSQKDDGQAGQYEFVPIFFVGQLGAQFGQEVPFMLFWLSVF